jgi:acylphosphatase
MSEAAIARHVIIYGRVQGVGYRAWVERMALSRTLTGWVRNRRDGTVEAVFMGSEAQVVDAIAVCRQGPRSSAVEDVVARDATEAECDEVRPSERFSVRPTA